VEFLWEHEDIPAHATSSCPVEPVDLREPILLKIPMTTRFASMIAFFIHKQMVLSPDVAWYLPSAKDRHKRSNPCPQRDGCLNEELGESGKRQLKKKKEEQVV
jgi:hypothetical protein